MLDEKALAEKRFRHLKRLTSLLKACEEEYEICFGRELNHELVFLKQLVLRVKEQREKEFKKSRGLDLLLEKENQSFLK